MCVRDMRVFAARSFFCISSFAFCDCFFFFSLFIFCFLHLCPRLAPTFIWCFLWIIWSTDSARYESRRLMPIAHPIQTIVKPTHIECNQQEQAIAKHTHIFCVECWPRPSSSHTHTHTTSDARHKPNTHNI